MQLYRAAIADPAVLRAGTDIDSVWVTRQGTHSEWSEVVLGHVFAEASMTIQYVGTGPLAGRWSVISEYRGAPHAVSPADVEARRYTYVSATWSAGPLTFRHWLVPSTRARQARAEADAVIAASGWPAPDAISLYPRNYIAKDRRLAGGRIHEEIA